MMMASGMELEPVDRLKYNVSRFDRVLRDL